MYITFSFSLHFRKGQFQILSTYMPCKHCSGPIFFTKIVSTLGDFHDCFLSDGEFGLTNWFPKPCTQPQLAGF